LQELRQDFKRKRLREPKLWFDKYSIDQSDIDTSLACLPVYLSGCSQLWILCGKTYLERLWCLIEIFVFLEMGGQHSALRVRMLGTNTAKGTNGRVSSSSLDEALLDFDPSRARCFTDYDTERLHTVIETTGYSKISALVRDAFLSIDESSMEHSRSIGSRNNTSQYNVPDLLT